MITEQSNYYLRTPNEIDNRLDFVHYHPELDSIKKFRETNFSEFFGKKVLTFDYGITESGKETGSVKFVNIQNLSENGEITNENITFLDNCPDNLKLEENDILISRSRLVGRAAKVTKDFVGETFGSYIIRFRLIPDSGYLEDFIVKYINSHFGQQQVILLKTGGSGQNINSTQLMNICLPKISIEKQEDILQKIEPLEKQAKNLENKVNQVLIEFEKILLSELSMTLLDLERIDNFFDFVKNENRLDFEYNNPRYDSVYQSINDSKYPIANLEDCVDFLRESRNPLMNPDDEFEYIDIGNIDTRFGDINSVTMMGKDATSSRMRRVIHEGNIIVSTTRPTRNAIALIPSHLDNQICSTGFGVLKCNDSILTDFLFLMLRSKFVTYQFQKLCSGSGYPEINQEKDLPKIKIIKPDSIKIQQEIVDEVKPTIEKAKSLLPKSQEKWEEAKDLFEKLVTS